MDDLNPSLEEDIVRRFEKSGQMIRFTGDGLWLLKEIFDEHKRSWLKSIAPKPLPQVHGNPSKEFCTGYNEAIFAFLKAGGVE